MNKNVINIDGKQYVQYDLKLAVADKNIIGEMHTFSNGNTYLKYLLNQLLLFKTDDRLAINKNPCLPISVDSDEIIPQHVYIISKEEVNVGDWSLYENVSPVLVEGRNSMDGDHKIIASSNPHISAPLITFDLIEEIVFKYSNCIDISTVLVEVELEWIAGTSTYGHGDYTVKPKVDSHTYTMVTREKNFSKEEVIKLCGLAYKEGINHNPNLSKWIFENIK